MESPIEKAYRRLNFLPIFSGNILSWVIVAALFSLGKLEAGVLPVVIGSWVLGILFGVKFVISILNAYK